MIRAEKLKPPGYRLAFQNSKTLRTPAGRVASHSGESAWVASSSLLGLLIGGAPALPIARPWVQNELGKLEIINSVSPRSNARLILEFRTR
jgi:hypothetical protein